MRALACVGVVVLAAAPAAAGDLTPQIKRGDFRFTLTGYLQEDFRSFHDWDAGDEDTGVLHSDTSELRRLRTGFELEWRALTIEFDADPHDDGNWLKNAYADVKVDKALRLRAGHFKLPGTDEWLTSAARTDFLERSMGSTLIVPGRDWGIEAHGQPAKWLGYMLGVFKGDGSQSDERTGTTGAVRLVFSPADDLDVGLSYSQGDVQEVPGVDPDPKGFVGEGPTGFQFYVRHFVDGRRRRWNADLAYTPGPFGLKGEYLEGREERKNQGSTFDDLPEEVARSWAGTASWLVTGESKKSRVEPRRPFPHGPGAIELAARFEELHFDDRGPSEGFAGAGNRARNIRPAADRAFTGGLSWWPVYWVRFMGDVVVERYLDPLLAPEPGRRGNYVTLVARVQVALP